MLAAERIEEIARIVTKDGGIKTSELSRMFEVSEMTILRDLSFLEKRGLLTRVYGGAVSARKNNEEISSLLREKTNIAEKNKIAELAVRLIKPSEQIFIDPSTTCLSLARKIKNIAEINEINIITNGLDIINELEGSSRVCLTCIGGDFHKVSMSFIGPLSEIAVKEIYFDKVFISPAGCAINQGITEINVYSVAFKKTIIENAKEVILLADYSKFEKVSLYKVCDWNQITTVVSDRKPADDFKRLFKNKNITFLG